MKKTIQSANGSSFHGHTVKASVNDLIKICGEPIEYGDPTDKVQYEWTMETENGDVFTIYDWKEYCKYSESSIIEWHIGAETSAITGTATKELSKTLHQ